MATTAAPPRLPSSVCRPSERRCRRLVTRCTARAKYGDTALLLNCTATRYGDGDRCAVLEVPAPVLQQWRDTAPCAAVLGWAATGDILVSGRAAAPEPFTVITRCLEQCCCWQHNTQHWCRRVSHVSRVTRGLPGCDDWCQC